MTHTDRELDDFGEWERQAWETRAAPYAASLGDLTRGGAAALLDAAGVAAGHRVLDVGTGPGFVALAAAARGADVTGVDQSRAMVEIARRAGIAATAASVTALPFEEASYDAVVGGFLLNHLPRPQVAVAELARVLRPGGRLALSVWDRPEANPALGLFGPLVTGLGVTGAVPPGPDSQLFSSDEPMLALLGSVLAAPAVTRAHWTVTVDPGAWFDAVASATPRTGAVLAAATEAQRSLLRERYVDLVVERYGVADGRAELPACAVIGSGTRS